MQHQLCFSIGPIPSGRGVRIAIVIWGLVFGIAPTTFAGAPKTSSSEKKAAAKAVENKTPPAQKEPAPPAKKRRHADGALSPADFQMEIPNPIPSDAGISFSALTYVELQYSYQYRWEEKGGAFTAIPTQMSIFSAIDPARSWNARPSDLRVLDHEQGHFDIAEIEAQKHHSQMKALVAEKKLLGKGKTEAEAKADLEAHVNIEFKKMAESMLAAQRDYDRVTYHGTDIKAQAQARKSHKEALAALSKANP